jgi:lipid-A-disaccharide synthase
VTTLGDPVVRARMGFEGVVAALPYYIGLLEDAARHAQQAAPDVFVPVDSPALHVPMARCVRAAGVPVVHLVAPQYWAWAPWRAGAYGRTIDRALTILPHEPRWYHRHGVASAHIGHPLLDTLASVPVTHPEPTSRTLAVLPGSRASVIRRNLPWMLASLGLLRAAWPDLDVVILQATEEHTPMVAELARGHEARIVVGDLHGELARARAAFAVSGTVLTDVLHHRLPAVVVYRVGRRYEATLQRALLTVPYFASTNLLAGREVVPEYGFAGAGPRTAVQRDLVALFGAGLRRSACLAGLELAAARLGPPGAIQRAAAHVLEVASARPRG